MSGLRSDSILYEEESYVILGSSRYDGLFDPQQFGITLDSYTSSPRALGCAYSVTDGTLLLSSLEIGSKGGVYPLINEIRPCFSHNLDDGSEEEVPEFYYQAVETRDARGKIAWRVDTEALYQGIDMPMAYTGTLRIGRDPDARYYLGFFLSGWPDWMHRKVLDLTFLDGHLESVTDLSDEMAKIREQRPTAEEYHASQPAPASSRKKRRT
jgi:hypothetical protein